MTVLTTIRDSAAGFCRRQPSSQKQLYCTSKNEDLRVISF